MSAKEEKKVKEQAWWMTARIYQILPHFFKDTNGDGIGDLRGIIEMIPKIAEDGFNAIWLPPVYMTPMGDYTYDVSNYYRVDPRLGSNDDLRELVAVAHSYGIRIILDVPLNHASIDIEEFQAAINTKHPRHAECHKLFHFTTDPDKYKGVPILFKDKEVSNWQRVRDLPAKLGWNVNPEDLVDECYFHRFYWFQPDWNYDEPEVRTRARNVTRFLLVDLDADLARYDAAPFFIKVDGTSCESLPQTHQFFQEECEWVEETFPGKGLLSEANQPPKELIQYNRDGFKANFDFTSMVALFFSLAKGDNKAIHEAIQRLNHLGIPVGTCLIKFLSLHDEKTWEDLWLSKRHFMWKHYGLGEDWRRQNWGTVGRIMELVRGDRRKFELLWMMCYALKGAKLVYYGEELGMGDTEILPAGEKDRRYGTRTIYPHTPGKNAGFSQCEPGQLFGVLVADGPFGYQAVNRQYQESMPNSVLNWFRRLNHLCSDYEDLMCTGEIQVLKQKNQGVATWLRTAPGRFGQEALLCVFNLTESYQTVNFHLKEYEGRALTEIAATISGGEVSQIGVARKRTSLVVPPCGTMYILLER